ncbi:peroxin, partial [Cladochytrium tenue]
RLYLTFSWQLLNVGWRACVARVRAAVDAAVGDWPLSRTVTFDSLLAAVANIRERVESDLDTPLTSFLLPPEGEEIQVLREGGATDEQLAAGLDPQLKRLLDETRDLLESPDFAAVLKASLDQSFELFTSQLRPAFFDDPVAAAATANDDARIVEIVPSKEMPLAAALPTVSKLVNAALNSDPNLFVDVLETLPELKALSVLVYTGWETGN